MAEIIILKKKYVVCINIYLSIYLSIYIYIYIYILYIIYYIYIFIYVYVYSQTVVLSFPGLIIVARVRE